MCDNKRVSKMDENKFNYYFSGKVNQAGREVQTCGQFTTSKNLVIHIPNMDKVHHALHSTLIDNMSTVSAKLASGYKKSILQ